MTLPYHTCYCLWLLNFTQILQGDSFRIHVSSQQVCLCFTKMNLFQNMCFWRHTFIKKNEHWFIKPNSVACYTPKLPVYSFHPFPSSRVSKIGDWHDLRGGSWSETKVALCGQRTSQFLRQTLSFQNRIRNLQWKKTLWGHLVSVINLRSNLMKAIMIKSLGSVIVVPNRRTLNMTGHIF